MAASGASMQFPVALVGQHASAVEQVSEAMDTARSAVHTVTMDSQAYGQLCQFLPAMLAPVFMLGSDALYGSVDALRETAANLRTAAANAEHTDNRAANRIDVAGGGGGGAGGAGGGTRVLPL